MTGFLRQSTDSQPVVLGPFVDDGDFKSLETGLTIANTDVKIVMNSGASANKNSGGGTHRANGLYGFTFNALDTASLGQMDISVLMSGALVVVDRYYVLSPQVYDAFFSTGFAGLPTNFEDLSIDAHGRVTRRN